MNGIIITDTTASLKAAGRPMDRYLLFIRHVGRDDVATFHTSEEAARAALVAYVRQQTADADQVNAADDAEAIRAYLG